MTADSTTTDSELLVALQRGLPLVERPFARLGEDMGLTEEQVLDRVRDALESGHARRLGAVFDIRRLGYVSTLCAAALDEDSLEQVVPKLQPHPGITHCYLRTPDPDLSPEPQHGPGGLVLPNLWFTLCAQGRHFDDELSKVREAVAPHTLLNLPAVKRFKIHVVFDPEQRDKGEQVPGSAAPAPGTEEQAEALPELSEEEKELVRAMQGHIEPVPRLYAHAAEETNYTADELLDLLRLWEGSGVLRRVALIVRHRKLGFRANGMCVWPVPEDEVTDKGRRLAQRPEITHCYQRVAPPEFPYSLYAMIHTDEWAKTRALFRELSDGCGLSDGLVFCSIREYKKTSHRLFIEDQTSEDRDG